MSDRGGSGRDDGTTGGAVELWTALADAQDQALAERQADQALARAATDALLRAQQNEAMTTPARGGRANRRVILLSAAGGAALAVAAVLLLMPARVPQDDQTLSTLPPLRFEIAGGPAGQVGRPLRADARSELPLRFSDGSQVTFLSGSSGQVERLTGHGAEVALHRGRVDVAVVHAPHTRWMVQAGPFRVQVTGTRFDVSWSPDQGQLSVSLREGSVVVDGSLLGAGVPLRAGQRLRVALSTGQVRTELLDSPMAGGDVPDRAPVPAVVPAPPAPAPPGVVRSTRLAEAPDWRSLAERGLYDRALQAAEREGLDGLARSLTARELLQLGDVARYAGAPAAARRMFSALVARYPRDRLSADAVFSLGRLESEAGNPDLAATWFDRYLRDWPQGPLAEQAAVRLREHGPQRP